MEDVRITNFQQQKPHGSEARAALDRRIFALASKFEILQGQPSKCVPAEVLRKAQGIVFLEWAKADFLYSTQGGNGIAITRDATSGHWSPAAFVRASLGSQAADEHNFIVLALMAQDATSILAGSSSGENSDASAVEASVWIYNSRHGFSGAALVKSGMIVSDDEANNAYYDTPAKMECILAEGKVPQSPSVAYLAGKLASFASAPQGARGS